VEVIRAAQKMADIEPESVSYIEAHGTGTIIGDPIEMKALNQAFNTQKKSFCAIGSAKPISGTWTQPPVSQVL
jgi:acyl transferase domain-containing protein